MKKRSQRNQKYSKEPLKAARQSGEIDERKGHLFFWMQNSFAGTFVEAPDRAFARARALASGTLAGTLAWTCIGAQHRCFRTLGLQRGRFRLSRAWWRCLRCKGLLSYNRDPELKGGGGFTGSLTPFFLSALLKFTVKLWQLRIKMTNMHAAFKSVGPPYFSQAARSTFNLS